jgi:hypothetical protein
LAGLFGAARVDGDGAVSVPGRTPAVPRAVAGAGVAFFVVRGCVPDAARVPLDADGFVLAPAPELPARLEAVALPAGLDAGLDAGFACAGAGRAGDSGGNAATASGPVAAARAAGIPSPGFDRRPPSSMVQNVRSSAALARSPAGGGSFVTGRRTIRSSSLRRRSCVWLPV